MIRPIISLRRKRIVIDIDTQADFFLAGGSACVRNHRRVISNIRRTVAWARRKNIRMISTIHTNNSRSGANFCVPGTDGHMKLSYTIRHSHVGFQADGCTDLPRDILLQHDQIVIEKRCTDPFDEPRVDRMLSELKVDEYIVIGAVTEDAVKAAVLGLLARRKNVTVLTDAVGSHDKAAAQKALRQMEAKGAKLTEAKILYGTSLPLVGACDCDRCRGRAKPVSAQVD